MRGKGLLQRITRPIEQRSHLWAAQQRFPFLKQFDDNFAANFAPLADAYADYVATVSTAGMAVSQQTAVLLHLFCQTHQPKNVVDLGSGFSSFILRSYAQTQPDVTVWSVDDNADWLVCTADFLQKHNLPTERLLVWDEFVEAEKNGRFDLIFHDLGYMDVRAAALPQVLKWGQASQAIVILDDTHKPKYNRIVQDKRQAYPSRFFDLAGLTGDDLGRSSSLLVDWELGR